MLNSFAAVQIGFVLLTLIWLGWLLVLFHNAALRLGYRGQTRMMIVGGMGLGVVAWLAILGAGAASGFFGDFTAMPPRLAIVILVPLVSIIWFVTRPRVSELLGAISPSRILQMQVFRVFVEVLLWMLFLQGLLPERMTFEGWNWDILVGITGPVAGYLFARNLISPTLVKIWNALGLLLLLNIVTIAILSAPLPFRVFMDEPANTIVTTFPAIWLPGFLVPLAYTLHIISWKQMSLASEVRLPTT